MPYTGIPLSTQLQVIQFLSYSNEALCTMYEHKQSMNLYRGTKNICTVHTGTFLKNKFRGEGKSSLSKVEGTELLSY